MHAVVLVQAQRQQQQQQTACGGSCVLFETQERIVKVSGDSGSS
jgi:hypothetical protein